MTRVDRLGARIRDGLELHAQLRGEGGELGAPPERAGRVRRHLEGEDLAAQGPQGGRVRGHLDAVVQRRVTRGERPGGPVHPHEAEPAAALG